ncbi:pyocin knob domain-containing protein [Levilactobacillus brevis]|uniref:pyocin knob domain-containing protein n=1 Tax=Levilactobacillus brevis TaxID=1580 RepID=UPI00374F6A68
MADSSRTIMTDAGFALETRVRADETKMQFTRAAISTDDHFSDTDDALAKLTELYNIQQDGKVTAVQVINTTTVYVQVDVNQAESKADYQMRSAALYAKDDDGTEVLYGVTVLQDPVFVHKDADGSYLGFGINTTVGKASNVVVVVDPANMVTQQVFESTMKNYYTKAEVDAKFVTDDDFASKLPKNIATTDAANTFVKSQTLAGGATDGKGNAYATTKDVATGLNNGLSTKVTDNKNGTIEVNGSSITPADDSKVVHSTVTQLNSTDMNTVRTTGFYQLISGTNGMPNADKFSIYQVIRLTSANGVQVAYGTNNAILGMRSWNSYGTTFTSWVQFADDSKVAHLSGANNFDTVPTVNNNPLLLASSLPSDLARTGSNQEFTGKNTFDTAPIDKATGNPYITKSGVPAVPSTLADTTKDANFTGKLQKSGIDVATKSDVTTAVSAVNANMVHRNPDTGVVSEPVDFTKLTVNGGKSVATSDDLKSLEASAWRQLDNKYITPASGYTLAPYTNILYKIDDSTHRLYLSGSIALTLMVNSASVTIQLGSIIKSILTLSVTYLGYHDVYSSWAFVHPTQSGTNLTFLPVEGVAGITGTTGTNGSLAYVTYDELV